MRIIVIDGQGGGIGRSLVEQLKKQCPQHEVLGVGINAIATAAMVKAGADGGATGESAVCYNCAHADVIVGPKMCIRDSLPAACADRSYLAKAAR